MRCIGLMLILAASAFAQEVQRARASYAENGVMIGLADLSPLRDCSVLSMEGRAREVKVREGTVSFVLKAEDKRMKFSFPLSVLLSADRSALREDFLHKGLRLRAAGYACGTEDEPLEAISIDRSY